MLLHINGKFTMGKLKSSLCRKVPLLMNKLGYKPFTINLYFNSSQYYPTLDKTFAIQLSLH